MPQPDEEIRDILGVRLDTMPDRPPIAWANDRDFQIPRDGTWLRARFAVASKRPLGINGGAPWGEALGAYFVDCFGPEGDGPDTADYWASQVAERFPFHPPLAGPTLQVRIMSVASTAGFGQQAGEPPGFVVPVTLYWRCVYPSG